MTKREQIQDNCEDALFALLMEDFARQEDQRLQEEAERLRQDPAAAVSSALNVRCRRLIRRRFARQSWRKQGRTAYRVFQYAASIVLVLGILFGTAWAISPEVQVGTLNLLIEMGGTATNLTLGSMTGGMDRADNTATDEEGGTILMGYRLPETPEGFEIEIENYTDTTAWIKYSDGHGAAIMVLVDTAEGATLSVDTEDAQSVESIQIHGFDGLLVEKGNRINIIWADTNHLQFVSVTCVETTKDFALNYANTITFEENNDEK